MRSSSPSAGRSKSTANMPFVPASDSLRNRCLATARAVGYRVPCPMLIPAGLVATRRPPGVPKRCKPLGIVGVAGRCGPSAVSWRGWVAGSSMTDDQHLVIVASPRPVGAVKLVNGPPSYPGNRVKVLRRVGIRGWHMQAVLVPPAANEGSAFANHVVLVWTVAGHTYGVGFHRVRGIARTLELDETLARHIALIGP